MSQNACPPLEELDVEDVPQISVAEPLEARGEQVGVPEQALGLVCGQQTGAPLFKHCIQFPVGQVGTKPNSVQNVKGFPEVFPQNACPPLEELDEVLFVHIGVAVPPCKQEGVPEQKLELASGQQIGAPLLRHLIQPPDTQFGTAPLSVQ